MKSIRTKILISFFVITLIPVIVIGVFSYKTSADALNKKISNSELYSLEQISKNIDKKLDMIGSFLDIAIISKEFQIDLSAKSGDLWMTNNNLDSFISNYFYKDLSNINVYFLGINEGAYSYRTNYNINKEQLESYKWYGDTLQMNGKINWIGTIKNPVNYSDIDHVYVAGRVVKNTSDVIEGKNIGTIFLALNENVIAEVYNNVSVEQTGSLMIVNEKGIIISHSDKNLLLNSISSYSFAPIILNNNFGYIQSDFDNTQSMIIYYTSPTTGYKILKIMPYDSFVTEISEIKYMTLLICMVCLILLFIISYILSRSIVLPIIALKDAMAEVKKGNFNANLKENSIDEIGQMISGYNFMIKELKKLFRKAIDEEKLKKQIEIKALQYQINPHFLYNVLGSIRLQAIMDGSDKSAKMIQSLSRLLSRTIGKAGEVITIAQEIENIIDFTYIQQVLYEGKISVKTDIDEDIHRYKVPNLLLQPIVENSIFHGMSENKEQTLTIKITGKRLGKKIMFEVYDNGKGMTEQQIRRILDDPNNEKKQAFSHVGIKNINDRIKLAYGDDYGLTIDSEHNQWTLVKVILPAVAGSNEYEHSFS